MYGRLETKTVEGLWPPPAPPATAASPSAAGSPPAPAPRARTRCFPLPIAGVRCRGRPWELGGGVRGCDGTRGFGGLGFIHWTENGSVVGFAWAETGLARKYVGLLLAPVVGRSNKQLFTRG